MIIVANDSVMLWSMLELVQVVGSSQVVVGSIYRKGTTTYYYVYPELIASSVQLSSL